MGQQLKIYRDHKNLTCKTFNTDPVFRRRLILEEYILEIENIPGERNIVVDMQSKLTNNGNQKSTHESKYTMETMSKLYGIDELPEGTFLLSFNIIDRYQREDSFILEKPNSEEYQKDSFCGGQNTIKLVTYKYKIVLPQKVQKYVMIWYHTYLLHPGLDQAEATIH